MKLSKFDNFNFDNVFNKNLFNALSNGEYITRKTNKKVIISWTGGVDSTALLFVALYLGYTVKLTYFQIYNTYSKINTELLAREKIMTKMRESFPKSILSRIILVKNGDTSDDMVNDGIEGETFMFKTDLMSYNKVMSFNGLPQLLLRQLPYHLFSMTAYVDDCTDELWFSYIVDDSSIVFWSKIKKMVKLMLEFNRTTTNKIKIRAPFYSVPKSYTMHMIGDEILPLVVSCEAPKHIGDNKYELCGWCEQCKSNHISQKVVDTHQIYVHKKLTPTDKEHDMLAIPNVWKDECDKSIKTPEDDNISTNDIQEEPVEELLSHNKKAVNIAYGKSIIMSIFGKSNKTITKLGIKLQNNIYSHLQIAKDIYNNQSSCNKYTIVWAKYIILLNNILCDHRLFIKLDEKKLILIGCICDIYNDVILPSFGTAYYYIPLHVFGERKHNKDYILSLYENYTDAFSPDVSNGDTPQASDGCPYISFHEIISMIEEGGLPNTDFLEQDIVVGGLRMALINYPTKVNNHLRVGLATTINKILIPWLNVQPTLAKIISLLTKMIHMGSSTYQIYTEYDKKNSNNIFNMMYTVFTMVCYIATRDSERYTNIPEDHLLARVKLLYKYYLEAFSAPLNEGEATYHEYIGMFTEIIKNLNDNEIEVPRIKIGYIDPSNENFEQE